MKKNTTGQRFLCCLSWHDAELRNVVGLTCTITNEWWETSNQAGNWTWAVNYHCPCSGLSTLAWQLPNLICFDSQLCTLISETEREREAALINIKTCSFIQIWTFLCIVNAWGLSSCIGGIYFALKRQQQQNSCLFASPVLLWKYWSPLL